MTEDQRNAILQIVAVLSGIAIFAVELIRSRVNSPATLAKKTDNAYLEGVEAGESNANSIASTGQYGRHGNG